MRTLRKEIRTDKQRTQRKSNESERNATSEVLREKNPF